MAINISKASSILLSTVIVIYFVHVYGELTTQVFGQEQEEIKPIPPVNITNQTTSHVSNQMQDVPIFIN